jgi:hypothetical protein
MGPAGYARLAAASRMPETFLGVRTAPMSQVDTRQLGRDSLFLLANLRFEEHGEIYRIKVRNLSSGGMMAEGDLKVAPGTAAQVELRNIGWVDGTVAWKQDGRFGLAFTDEIDPKRARARVGGSADDLSTPRFTRPPLHQPVPSTFANLRKI